MLFTEGRFFLLYALVFPVYWALGDHRARKRLLLVASYVFYGAWDWRYLGLLWLTTAVDYAAGLLLDDPARPAGSRKRVLGVALTANLGILGVFKYFDFFATNGAAVLGALGLDVAPPLLRLVLPAGISFYTFQSMSYSIDVYRGMRAERKLLDYSLFVTFFPQLVAGPIVRAGDFLPQLTTPRRWADVDARAALVLFWVGFVKKAVIADNVAPLVDAYFGDPQAYTAGSGWSAALLYNVQIFCDFSGYSDMAIASAGLLGYHLRPNFRFPFLATSPLDYWRRWHMSFSTWLRDYLYIPLGGSRGSEVRTRWNILITLLLSGLWHGAGWHFVAYGGLHGIAILNEREWRQTALYARIPPRVRAVLGVVFTHALGTVLRVVFRAPTLAAAGPILAALLVGASTGAHALPGWGWPVWGALVLGQYVASRGWLEAGWRRLPPLAFAVALGVGWAAALALRAIAYRPFVYFAF